jgi:hypothetical protein
LVDQLTENGQEGENAKQLVLQTAYGILGVGKGNTNEKSLRAVRYVKESIDRASNLLRQ